MSFLDSLARILVLQVRPSVVLPLAGSNTILSPRRMCHQATCVLCCVVVLCCLQAKLNSHTGYVQGMHEIAWVLFYQFITDGVAAALLGCVACRAGVAFGGVAVTAVALKGPVWCSCCVYTYLPLTMLLRCCFRSEPTSAQGKIVWATVSKTPADAEADTFFCLYDVLTRLHPFYMFEKDMSHILAHTRASLNHEYVTSSCVCVHAYCAAMSGAASAKFICGMYVPMYVCFRRHVRTAGTL